MRRMLAVVLCFLPACPTTAQEPVGSAFTYQGQLKMSGLSLSGDFDFRFEVYDAETDGTMLDQLDLEDISVEEGLFSVELDFGASIFNTEATWLQVGVRDGASTGNYTSLTPRSRITPAPYAIQAAEATNANSLAGLSASDFLRADGAIVASELTVSGELDVTELVFPDGTRQSTASTSSIPAIEEPTTYVPAFLTCGDSPESDPMQWTFITGRFQITIDGVQYEPQASFPGAVTMDDVATDLQEGIRAATGGQELVEWQTDHFVITSGDTSSSSSITTASAPSVGIDISGESVGNNWMDCDDERSVTDDLLLDGSADDGKLIKLNQDGEIDDLFLPLRRIASSTEFSSSTTTTEVEVMRFRVPGGTIREDSTLRIKVKGSAFGGISNLKGYFGGARVAELSISVGGSESRYLEIEIDVMGDGGTSAQKIVSSAVARNTNVQSSSSSIVSASVDASQNFDFYLTVRGTEGGAGISISTYTAWLIK